MHIFVVASLCSAPVIIFVFALYTWYHPPKLKGIDLELHNLRVQRAKERASLNAEADYILATYSSQNKRK